MEKRKKMVRELVLQKVEFLANKGPHHLPRTALIEVFLGCNLDCRGPMLERPTNEEIVEVLNELIIKKKIRLSGLLEANGHIHTLIEIP